MQQVNLERVDIDESKLLRGKVEETDTSLVYSQPGIYCLNGEPVIIYGKLSAKYDRMLWAVKSYGYSQEMRTTPGGHIASIDNRKHIAKAGGLGQSGIFGYRPRLAFSANYCAACGLAQKFPAQHAIMCDFGRLLNAVYERAAPETAAKHSDALKAISADWIIPGTRFTSGIVNRNNPLRYHHDKGNIHGAMSCMVVFRNLCEGGLLSVPEFNARWVLDDHTFFLFDGQKYLHGVTPIKKLTKHSYRYSVVYYALRAMAKCGTLEEEISRARSEKRAREKRRV